MKTRADVEEELDAEAVRRLDDGLLFIMSTEQGRATMHWLIYDVGRLQSAAYNEDVRSIKDGMHAAMVQSYWEGARHQARKLLEALNETCPEQVVAMNHEAGQRALEARARLKPSTVSHTQE